MRWNQRPYIFFTVCGETSDEGDELLLVAFLCVVAVVKLTLQSSGSAVCFRFHSCQDKRDKLTQSTSS